MIAQADSLKVTELFNKLPIKEGVTYDYTHKRFLNTVGVEVASLGGFNLDASYIGVDGVGGSLTYNLGNLPVKNLPVLNYVQYLNAGYSVGVRTITLNQIDKNPESDNKLIHGPTLFAKIKF